MHRCFIVLLFFSIDSFCYADSNYLPLLIKLASEKQLADRAEWHALLHYKSKRLLPGVSSQVDGVSFFNAANGKSDPQAELEATLAAFFAKAVVSQEQQHVQCLFSARYDWLKQMLGFDARQLPEQACPRFSAWRATINPAGLTLIFSSAYLNNPASMFGHTFLRIDGQGQDERSRLLAYTISYAANTEERNGIVFAMKGLFGGYPGMFSVLPYYLKVKEYSDLENRDVWEYQLNFTVAEIDQLLRHVWELRYTYFDYYFFDENCAYHLLSILDVARPGLNLVDQIWGWAIPSDTVRIVSERKDLLTKVVYRPALSTQLAHRLAQIDDNQQQMILDMVHGDVSLDDKRLAVLADEERMKALELAFDYIEYERGINQMSEELTDQQLAILRARSQMNSVYKLSQVPTPQVRPDQGHRTARVSVGVGEHDGDRFVELALRPAYHDLLDPVAGYISGAELKFATLTLRYFQQQDDLQLEDLTLLGIQSITVRNRFFKSVSWRMNFGLSRQHFNESKSVVVAQMRGGPGLSYALSPNFQVYGFTEGVLDIGTTFRNKYAGGMTLSAGALLEFTPDWRMNLSAKATRYVLGDTHNAYEINWEQSLRLNDQNTLRFKFTRQGQFDYHGTDMSIAWQRYF